MNPLVQEYAIGAGRTALYIALFPFTHIAFYILLSVWLVLKHTVILPVLLSFRIALFGLVYLPLTPVLTVADVEYSRDTTVESSLWQLAVHMAPHVAFFALHLLHYVIIAAVAGTIVGCFTGLNISLVSKVLTPPSAKDIVQDEFNRTWARMEELRAQLPQKEPIGVKGERRAPERAELVKNEEEIAISPVSSVKAEPSEHEIALVPAELSVADIVQNEPKRPLKAGEIDFSDNGADLTYEDDDGYNYMRYREIPRKGSIGKVEGEIEEAGAAEEEEEEEDEEEDVEEEEEEEEEGDLEDLEEEDEESEVSVGPENAGTVPSLAGHPAGFGVPTIEEEPEETGHPGEVGESEGPGDSRDLEAIESETSEGPFSGVSGLRLAENKTLPQRSPRRPFGSSPPTEIETRGGSEKIERRSEGKESK